MATGLESAARKSNGEPGGDERQATATGAQGMAQAPALQLAAGREALEWQRILTKTKSNVVAEVLRHQGDFFQWSHYPPGDVFDPASRSQWYYHAHPKDQRPGEHGHFHTFVRQGERPSHLLGIAMDKFGKPVQLFTTNRWVTGEEWRPAAELMHELDRFDLELASPSWPVNRWLVAIFRCYRPLMAELLDARDRRIAEWRERHPEAEALDDKRLEVTSSQDIDLERDVAALATE